MVMSMADEFQGSLRELRRALELNPSLAAAYLSLSDLSTTLGDTQEMLRAAEEAYRLDPLSPRTVTWLGGAYFFAGRGEEAMEHWRKTLHLDPYRTYRRMFDYYVSKGEYGEAEKAVKEMERLCPALDTTILNRGYLAASTGDEKTAREMIAKLDRGAGVGTTPEAGFIYYALGDLDRFFEYQFRAAKDHTLSAGLLRYSPLFEKARRDPRLEEAFRMAGIPYETSQSSDH